LRWQKRRRPSKTRPNYTLRATLYPVIARRIGGPPPPKRRGASEGAGRSGWSRSRKPCAFSQECESQGGRRGVEPAAVCAMRKTETQGPASALWGSARLAVAFAKAAGTVRAFESFPSQPIARSLRLQPVCQVRDSSIIPSTVTSCAKCRGRTRRLSVSETDSPQSAERPRSAQFFAQQRFQG